MKRSARQTKPTAVAEAAGQQGRTGSSLGPMMTDLYRRAEAQLRRQKKQQKSKAAGVVKTETDSQRLLHELQVHQVELEMQNSELQEARDRMEALLEKYTDFYDFAPVGYLSLDENGQILEVNLNGATLLGVSRAQLINRRLPPFITLASRPTFLAFLKRVFAGGGKQVCEATILREDGKSIWADFHGTLALSSNGPKKWCRMVVTDITVLKRAEEAQRRSDAIAAANEELRQEIERRKVIEESLKKSEQHQRRLLEESRLMEEQLRNLSRQVLQAQEEERKRISRELHDVIAQTLTGINVRLAALKKEATFNTKHLDRDIARTQRLVEKSVDIVHQFARELRPAVLDDLGLIPALHSFVKLFSKRTRVHVHLKIYAGVEQLNINQRTILYRVAQEALTNVSRHAQASRVEVDIQKLPDGVCMKINDNGKSFKLDRVLNARGRKRLGLLGMRERLQMVGGHFDIESVAGKGTTIIAKIPLSAKRGGR
ncbi:MAG TPA: histidine kinase [Verrucomicrobiae bacterium]